MVKYCKGECLNGQINVQYNRGSRNVGNQQKLRISNGKRKKTACSGGGQPETSSNKAVGTVYS